MTESKERRESTKTEGINLANVCTAVSTTAAVACSCIASPWAAPELASPERAEPFYSLEFCDAARREKAWHRHRSHRFRHSQRRLQTDPNSAARDAAQARFHGTDALSRLLALAYMMSALAFTRHWFRSNTTLPDILPCFMSSYTCGNVENGWTLYTVLTFPLAAIASASAASRRLPTYEPTRPAGRSKRARQRVSITPRYNCELTFGEEDGPEDCECHLSATCTIYAKKWEEVAAPSALILESGGKPTATTVPCGRTISIPCS